MTASGSPFTETPLMFYPLQIQFSASSQIELQTFGLLFLPFFVQHHHHSTLSLNCLKICYIFLAKFLIKIFYFICYFQFVSPF